MRWRNRASSTTSGSVAALWITVRPSASTAESMTVSVAPTDGYGRVMRVPLRRPTIRAVIPWGCTSISAPICCRAATWKSTGRRPIRSPPTRGTKASWARWRSGPSSRIGMRFRPENSSGTRGVGSGVGEMVMASPSMSTPNPMDRRMSAVMPTSPTFGALVIVEGLSPIRAATMCLVTAFFEPATSTSPLSGPLGSMCQAGPVPSGVGSVTEPAMGREATPGDLAPDPPPRSGAGNRRGGPAPRPAGPARRGRAAPRRPGLGAGEPGPGAGRWHRHRAHQLGTAARTGRGRPPRRLRRAHGPARDRRGRARHGLRALVLLRLRSRRRSPRRASHPLRGRHARRGPGRRPPAALHVLGADLGHVVPPHRQRPHEDPKARAAALHALLITVRGRPGDAGRLRRCSARRRAPTG